MASFLAVAALLIATSHASAAESTAYPGIEVAPEGSWAPSVAADPSGHLHLAYVAPGQTQLWYATNVTGTWQRTLLLNGNVGEPEIAVDHLGSVHLVVPGPTGLTYVTNRSGSWRGYLVAAGGYGHPSITTDPLGEAHVATTGANGDVFYFTNRHGFWMGLDLGYHNAGMPTIALDEKQHPHLAFAWDPPSGGRRMWHLTDASGAWVLDGVSAGDAEWPDIDITAGRIRVAYESRSSPRGIVIATLGATWSLNQLTTSNRDGSPTLEVDPSGKPHVAWRDGATYVDTEVGNIGTATNATGSWKVTDMLQTGDVDMAIAPDGSVHYIVGLYGLYHVIGGQALGWSRSIVYKSGDLGTPSVAVAPDGTGHLVVAKGSTGLRFGTYSGTWSFSTISANDDHEPSLAIDSLGHAHVAFVRKLIGVDQLWYATNASGSWVKTMLEQTTSLVCPVLALSPGGNAFIAVRRDASNQHVVFYSNRTGAWMPGLVLPRSGDTGCPGVAADGGNHAHVVYQYGTGLAYLNDTDIPGSFVVVTQFGTGAESPGLVIASGKVTIAYGRAGDYQSTNRGIWLRSNRTGSWTDERITDIGGGPDRLDIGWDANKKVYVAFAGGLDLGIHYVTKVGSLWIDERLTGERGTSVSLDVLPDGTSRIAYDTGVNGVALLSN